MALTRSTLPLTEP
uniref:Uncharacterized protein n=1 Tax=Anguilla anguilla TaxID=7936 RepID=A0A0E9T9X2_ANGAN